MKSILLILILSCTSICFAQKEYTFDYFIEYDLTLFKDSLKNKYRSKRVADTLLKKFLLTNSKNNQFIVILSEANNKEYQLVFKDFKGVYSKFYIDKEEFVNASIISLKCSEIVSSGNLFRRRNMNYEYQIHRDTLIQSELYHSYFLKYKKPKKAKNKEIGSNQYIVRKEDNSYHLPIFILAVEYYEWENEKSIPNGIFSTKVFFNYMGKKSNKYELRKIDSIKKKITVPKDCYNIDK